jgi:hypothetical protein
VRPVHAARQRRRVTLSYESTTAFARIVGVFAYRPGGRHRRAPCADPQAAQEGRHHRLRPRRHRRRSRVWDGFWSPARVRPRTGSPTRCTRTTARSGEHVVAVDTVDHPSDRQLVEHARQRFATPDPLDGLPDRYASTATHHPTPTPLRAGRHNQRASSWCHSDPGVSERNRTPTAPNGCAAIDRRVALRRVVGQVSG